MKKKTPFPEFNETPSKSRKTTLHFSPAASCRWSLAALLFSIFLLTGATAAMTIATETATDGGNLAYSGEPSAADLINAGQPTLLSSSVTPAEYSTVWPTSGINDGNYSTTSTDSYFGRIDEGSFPCIATYDLDTSTNSNGYDITSIVSFMGWEGYNNAQGNQTYTVEVSRVSSLIYTPLAIVDFTPFSDVDGGHYESRATITDSGGILATNVQSVRFTFAAPRDDGTGSNDGTVIREVDVFGTASSSEAGFVLPSVTITSPTSRHIVQRSATDRGAVSISGAYGSCPDQIEARAVVMTEGMNSGTTTSWQTIDSAPSGNAYSGTLTNIPAGGWYQLEVRGTSGSTNGPSAALEKIGVGDIFVCAGQSNASDYGDPARACTNDRVSARIDITSSTWALCEDPVSLNNSSATGGSPWTRLGEELVAAADLPVGFLCVAHGGTRVDQWVPGEEHYTKLSQAVQSFPANGFRAVLWHQGESDSRNGTAYADYVSRLSSVIAESRADAGWDVPWYVAEVSTFSTSDCDISSETPTAAAQRQVIHSDPLTHFGASTDWFHLEDGNGGKLCDSVHFNAVGLLDHAQQWRDILCETTTLGPRNGSFEDNRTVELTDLSPLDDGSIHEIDTTDYDSPYVIGWRVLSASGIAAADGSNGFFNPDADTYSGAVDTTNSGVMANMDGKHVAMLTDGSAGNYFLHSTRVTAETNTLYTLNAAIGVRDSSATFGGAELEILTNGVAAASACFDKDAIDARNGSDASGMFTDLSVSWNSGSSASDNPALAVRIVKTDGESTVLDFDNVRFTSAPADSQEAYDTVIANGTAPVVTLLDSSVYIVDADSSYVDPGATAFDVLDGNISPAITFNDVIPDVAGTYTIQWQAVSSAGLTGTVTRTVYVVDSSTQSEPSEEETETFGNKKVSDLTVKTTGFPADMLIVSDSADSHATKQVALSDTVNLMDEMIAVPDYGTVEDIAYPGAYEIGKYEVSYALWSKVFKWSVENGYAYDGYSASYWDNSGAFTQATRGPGGTAVGPTHPVQCVTWYDCVKWCNARSEMEGRSPAYYTIDSSGAYLYRAIANEDEIYLKSKSDGYRLPTADEWEYAARAGVSGDVFSWGTSTKSTEYLNYNINLGVTTVCGSYSLGENALGAYDFNGNVWEWIFDWYVVDSTRTRFGSSWYSGDSTVTNITHRNPMTPDYRGGNVGFRVVRSTD